MSANDILDVLNIKRDDTPQPAKKKQKVEYAAPQKGAMARELYNLLGPNTPPVSLSLGANKARDRKQKVSPWTKMPFKPNKKNEHAPQLYHWQKGSEELLKQESAGKPYFFDKFSVSLDIPELVDEATYDHFMEEILQEEKERNEQELKDKEEEDSVPSSETTTDGSSEKVATLKNEQAVKLLKDMKDTKSNGRTDAKVKTETDTPGTQQKTRGLNKSGDGGAEEEKEAKEGDEIDDEDEEEDDEDEDEVKDNEGSQEEKESDKKEKDEKARQTKVANSLKATTDVQDNNSITDKHTNPPWSYKETQLLFDYCKVFELKWYVIADRFPYDRTMEELKEQFYRISAKILNHQGNANPHLVESLESYSKDAEIDRKQYLESLLKRTPAEIAEEESLVIEARRFELAAKKMLMERSHLLTLLDSPQSSQSVQQYLSSLGMTNLYNKLMIMDKQQKKKMSNKSNSANTDPVPPSIPVAASSSSYKKDRGFQTHLQQYLSGLVKQLSTKGEPSPIQQLLSKRLTTKEEEAYGLHYHANERLTPGVILRSTQRLPGLQQRQSVFKSVNSMLQELDIPTAGSTTWKPVMPTRKTMAKYDELIRAVVALLDVKKGKDKLEAEIELIKSQRGLQ